MYHLSLKKRKAVVTRIKRLKRRLEQLSLQLKLGFSAASISLVLSSASLNAQELGPFVENQPANPFSEGVVSSNPEFANERPALVDIDGDGDLDVFLNTDAGIVFLRNDI